MSVQSVQAFGLEQLPPPGRAAGPVGVTQPRGAEAQVGPAQPEDRVSLSEHARKLSLSGAAQGSGAEGEVELKLDFRKLRELVASPSRSQTDGG